MLSIVLKWGSFQEVLRPNTVIDCFHKGYTEPKTSIKPTFSSCFKPTLITKWEVCIPNWRKVFKLRGWEWGLCWDRRSKIYSCNKKNKFILSRFMPFENGSMLSSWLSLSFPFLSFHVSFLWCFPWYHAFEALLLEPWLPQCPNSCKHLCLQHKAVAGKNQQGISEGKYMV